MPCVLLTDAETASPYKAGVDLEGVYDLSVKGHNGLTNTAGAQFDPVYYHALETPVLNLDDSGIFYGVIIEETGIASGATATIAIKLQPCCVVPEEVC
jgi:hypothetical protein